MEKEHLLQAVRDGLADNTITHSDIENVLDGKSGTASSALLSLRRHVGIVEMFYALGALIVILGASIFIGQQWDVLGAFGRIAVTLGVALITYILGMYLYVKSKESGIGAAFHIIAGILFPLGIVVTLHEMGGEPTDWLPAIVGGMLTIVYGATFFSQRTSLILFFLIGYATLFLHGLYFGLTAQSTLTVVGDIYAYLVMITGVAYLYLSHQFGVLKRHTGLVGVLNFFGASYVLIGPALIFEGFWELFYILLITALYVVSVSLKSKVILVLSTIALMGYITYLTGEYFADVVGWPLALVAAGFILIGIGYTSFRLSKKYIT